MSTLLGEGGETEAKQTLDVSVQYPRRATVSDEVEVVCPS